MAELALGWVEEKILTLSIGEFHPGPAGSKVVDPTLNPVGTLVP
jgi:hypothetical protein